MLYIEPAIIESNAKIVSSRLIFELRELRSNFQNLIMGLSGFSFLPKL